MDRGRDRPRLKCSMLWSLALIAMLISVSTASDDIQWKQIGPGGGGNMVNCVVSPSKPDLLFSSSDVGGFFRSEDGGVTWTIINGMAARPTYPAGYDTGPHMPFAFDPSNPSIVYNGPQRSTDDGKTWQVNVDDRTIYAGSGVIDSDPNNHDVVYAYGFANVYRTSDGWRGQPYTRSCLPPAGSGQTSAPNCESFDANINGIVIDPSTTTHLVACSDAGLFQSTDSAQTWSQLNDLPSLPPALCSGGSTPGATCTLNADCPGGGVCQSPSCVAIKKNPTIGSRTLYISLETRKGTPDATGWVDIDSWSGGLFKSTNWVASWTSMAGSDGGNILGNFGFNLPGDADHPAASWLYPDANSRSTVTWDTDSRTGTTGHSIKVTSSGTVTGGGIESGLVSIVGGDLYRFSFWAKVNSSSNAVLQSVQSRISYFSAQGVAVTLAGVVQSWVDPISTDTGINPQFKNFSWRRFEALVRPPAAAAFADVAIYVDNYNQVPYDGITWFDEVSLTPATSLPKISCLGQTPGFMSYFDLAIDPSSPLTVYAGTEKGIGCDLPAETSGIWKTTNGGNTWALMTRSQWHDNVLDNGSSFPRCGDGVCGGRWETCNTCPDDCSGGSHPASACCGDNIEQSLETDKNCLVDKPYDKDPNPRPYYEADFYRDQNGTGSFFRAAKPNGGYGVWSIGIGTSQPPGSPIQGSQTLCFGSGHKIIKTTDGGVTWSEITSYAPVTQDSLQARGENNDVYSYSVASDTRGGHDWLFYGDDDNLLQVSYNGGQSFGLEGWQWSGDVKGPNTSTPYVLGDSAQSILFDSNSSNRVYVSVSYGGANRFDPNNTSVGGVVQGDLAAGRWQWTPFGNQASFPKASGSIDLIQTNQGTFLASVYGRGIYRLGSDNNWTNAGEVWNPAPACDSSSPPICWKTYRLLKEPTIGRLYVGVGYPLDNFGTPPAPVVGETGLWESSDGGMNWRRISSTPGGSGASMDQQPVTDVVALNPTTLLASTWFAGLGDAHDVSGNYTGSGGIYRGTCTDTNHDGQCDTGFTWTWTKVLSQPIATSLAVSPASSSIVYAFIGQRCCANFVIGQNAGIYKSVDAGLSWTRIANSNLMNLFHGRLYFHSSNHHKLYASTIGNGVFEGTISCGPVSEGFPDADNDGIPDCADTCTDTDGDGYGDPGYPANTCPVDCAPSNPAAHPGALENLATGATCFDGVDNDCDGLTDLDCAVDASSEVPVTGTISGGLNDIKAGSTNNVYENITELTVSGRKRLTHIWAFANATPGVNYDLKFEGFRNVLSPMTDAFTFGNTTSTSCSNSLTFPNTPMTVNKLVTDGNSLQSTPVGTVTTGAPVLCIKLSDANVNDSSGDTASIDRLYLFPVQPPQTTVASGESLPADDLGAVIAGNFGSTQAANEGLFPYEQLKEQVFGNTSRLQHYWIFSGVPSGSSYKLHFEGYRPDNPDTDNFQFYWATSPTGTFTLIPGLTVSSPTEAPGGVDSSSFVPTGFTGTLYIQVRDTNSSAKKTSTDSIFVDQLLIKTFP